MTLSAPERPLGDDASHLLLVDDDARIRTLLARFLSREGFRVSVAASAREARAQLANMAFDLAVVDVMMPGESGLDLVASLRRGSDGAAGMPVLMLTARTEPADRIGGLEAGADDYLGKPFEPRELLLRIRAVLRRASASHGMANPVHEVRFGAFRFHLERGDLFRDEHPVRLTDRDRAVLRVLAREPGRIIPRAALESDGGSERAVDVQVTRLRRKIEPDPNAPIYLQTARGVGYRLVAQPIHTEAGAR